MFTDYFSEREWAARRSGSAASGYDNSPKSGPIIGDDDMQGQPFGPSVPPICHICEIAIMPGSDHTTVVGHFAAMKAFVQQCQDELESTRMRDFQHPTREELIKGMLEMEEQFNKLAQYSDTLVEHIRKLLHAKL